MKISVIIPVYNKARYLNNLLSDLLKQTFTEYECILIDDGSVDDSGEICDNISKIDNRFRTFHLINGGVSNARNYGICQSEGDYITFIDADDRLYPEYLNNLFRCIIENEVDLVISGLEKYWDGSDKKECICPPYFGRYNKDIILPRFAQIQKDTGIFGFCVAKIFRKDLVRNVKFDSNLSLAEDFDFYLNVYRKVHTFYFDDKCYYRYLQCADNSSSTIADNQIDYLAQLKIKLRFKNFLIEQDAYADTNKQIIDEMISNYVYFVLFYSSKKNIYTNFIELRSMVGTESAELKGKSVLQKWILLLFRRKQLIATKITLVTYRKIRALVKKLKIQC